MWLFCTYCHVYGSRGSAHGEIGKPGEVIRGLRDGSPQRGPGAEPLVGVRGQSLPKQGSGADLPETEQVLMIIKTFLAETLLIKSCIYSIIRSLTNVLISSRQLLKCS